MFVALFALPGKDGANPKSLNIRGTLKRTPEASMHRLSVAVDIAVQNT